MMSRTMALSNRLPLVWMYALMAILVISGCCTTLHAASLPDRTFRVQPMPPYPGTGPTDRPRPNRQPLGLMWCTGSEELMFGDTNAQNTTLLPTENYALIPMISPRGGIAAYWMLKPAGEITIGSVHAEGGGPVGDVIGVWLMDLGTGQTGDTPIFDASVGMSRGSISSYYWGEDGRHLYVATNGPSLPYIWEVDTWRAKSDPVVIAGGTAPFVYGDQLFYVSYTYFPGTSNVSGSTVHIQGLSDFSEQTKYFPNVIIARAQTDGTYLYYSTVSGPGAPATALWKWKFGDPGYGEKVTSLQTWYFNLADDRYIYAASAFLAAPNWNLAVYRIHPITGVATYLTDGLYPHVGPRDATPSRHWLGFMCSTPQ